MILKSANKLFASKDSDCKIDNKVQDGKKLIKRLNKDTNKELVNDDKEQLAKEKKIDKELECIDKKSDRRNEIINENTITEAIMISNKTKLIEKKLNDEMNNQFNRERNSTNLKPNSPSAQSNSTSNSNQTKSRLNSYKNGYIMTYFENNTQKNFNKLLYSQNSFDSGLYSPSSNDSYNLSSTSGSCSALIYSTSGSEQNTLNTNRDSNCSNNRQEFSSNRKDFQNRMPINKEMIYLDSIDPLPTSFRISSNNNLTRNLASFNKPAGSFTHWTGSSYRKYYSTEILSGWN